MSTPDFSNELTNRPGDAATSVDPGDGAAAPAGVRPTAFRREQRRRAVMGVAAVGALLAGGAVVSDLSSSDGDDFMVSSAAPVDTEPVTTEGAEQDAPTPTNDTEPAATPVMPTDLLEVTPSSMEEFDGDRSEIEGEFPGDLLLYPWEGGFLNAIVGHVERQLPAVLPPELAERLPQEALDLFPDGFPTRMTDAQATLHRTGLFDLVGGIVLTDPELADLMVSPPQDRVTSFRFSEDGDTWSDIEVELPVDDDPTIFASTGDLFVVASPVPESDGYVSDDPTAIDLWWSADLVTWERQAVELPSRPAGLPDFVVRNTNLKAVTANDDGWIVSLQQNLYFDTTLLLDDDQLARGRDGGGFGSSTSDVGLTMTVYPDSHGDDGEDTEVSWDELGLDGPPDEEKDLTFSARWGGDVEETEIGGGDAYGIAPVAAVDSGFVSYGRDLRLSADGVQWSLFELPEPGTIEWFVEIETGLLLGGTSQDGTAFRLLFDPASSEFRPAEVAEGPASGTAQRVGSNAVVLVSQGFRPPAEPGALSVESSGENGYVLELEARGSAQFGKVSYVLSDATTGDIVSSESLDEIGTDAQFEFLAEVNDGSAGFAGYRITDPESGEVLAEVPFDDLIGFGPLDADGRPVTLSEYQILRDEYAESSEESDDDEEGPAPETWLIAGVDGSLIVQQLGQSFTVEQIDGSEATFPVEAASVAVRDDAVLMLRWNGTTTRVAVDD